MKGLVSLILGASLGSIPLGMGGKHSFESADNITVPVNNTPTGYNRLSQKGRRKRARQAIGNGCKNKR